MTVVSRVRSPLKYHGGKSYLAQRIADLCPPHLHYVEPYFGGGSVLLAKDPEGVSEVVNDINRELFNFWRVLSDLVDFPEFQRRVEAIPLSRDEWESASFSRVYPLSRVDEAVRFFVACRQSLAGRMKSFTAITRTRTRRGMNGNVSEWLSAVDGLPEVHARLRRVLIENKPALDLIRSEDTPDTLFYLDPPYLHETRATKDAYDYEMGVDDHVELVNAVNNIKGKVMLSGYASDLYDKALSNLNRHDFDLPNNAASGKSKRRMVECVWTNF